MAKIEEFDRGNLAAVRAALEAALKTVQADFGLGIQLKTMRFDAHAFRATIEGGLLGDAPDLRAATEKRDFLEFAALYDLTPADYGRAFENNGQQFTLIAIKPGREKYPFIGQRADGKRFKFSAAALCAAGIKARS